VSLSISVMLILASVISIQVSNVFEKSIKENVKINVFLKETVKEKEINSLKENLGSNNYAANINYISKDQAAEIFVNETGEDFRSILDYNPLPASFVIQIKDEYSNDDSLNNIIRELAGTKWVDEVVFKDRFIYKVLGYIDSTKIYLFIITGIVGLIALYLVYTTIRLIIRARFTEFETMKLVGAKLSTIKFPVILNGLLAGIISSIICITIFLFVEIQVRSFPMIVDLLKENEILYFVMMLFTGPVLGMIVTFFALRNISLKI
jgi:cell division transport system permease protein